MNHPEDNSSDDVPYLPPDQYQNYENQQRIHQSQNPEHRRGRSHFTEEELQELDSISLEDDNTVASPATVSSIPRPISEPDIIRTAHHQPEKVQNQTAPTRPPRKSQRQQNSLSHSPSETNSQQQPQPYQISWGRRAIGLLLITIPAVLFSVAAHFLDWAMSDFQLFSASFFIFQGIFWPCFGILLTDLFCTPTKHVSKNRDSIRAEKASPTKEKEVGRTPKENWILAIWVFIHSNLSAAVMILQILSIQRLNISISLALSFGFDVLVMLIRYIVETKRCSWELLLLSAISYCGYGVAAIPAFLTSTDKQTASDTANGVGASIGVMLLSVPASLVLTHLRRHQVRESVLGTSFAFFGCIQALITKEIMGSTFDLQLDGYAVGWVIGLISVVFLGTIFLHLEARLSGLIWDRDEDDKPTDFSSITRTRIAVFILSCLWELGRQGFRGTTPVVYDIVGGFLVMLSFLLAGGYQAWHRSNQIGLDTADSRRGSAEAENKSKFCAFMPWLFSQKHSYINREND